ncbi:MAG: adenylate/guanylate cyclase domain-containing protein [Candidatus Ozemobacteraceae bacterium]
MSDFLGPEKKGLAARIPDVLAFLASVAIFWIAYLVSTNKVPKTITWAYEHFYLFATVGFLGFIGEKFAVTLLIFFLPVALIGGTYFLKFKPDKFPLEDWFASYSLLVVFSALFTIFLFYRWEQTKKMKDSNEGPKERVDPRAAVRYRQEQVKKEAAEEERISGSLVGLPAGTIPADDGKRKLKGKKEEKASESIDPNETAEQRNDRELRQLKDDFSRKSMKLSTTLLRMKNLSRSLDRDEIFSSIIEIIAKGLDGERVQLLLNNEKDGCLRVVRAEGMQAKEYKDLVISHDETSMIGYLMKLSGSGSDSGSFGTKECEIDPKTRGLIGQGVLKTILAVPINVDGKIFGVINIEKMKNPDYTRDDQNLIATCADVAGLVMKNAKLYAATMDDLVSTKKISEEQLRKNEELKGSLSRIVSPRVAELIMHDPSGLKLGGTKCEVTVFFTDVRGFTRMSEGMDPQALVEQLNVYFTRMTDILMELDGTLDKYVGDELMALFGAPVGRPDDPIRAVLCGVRMLDALRELQVVWKKEGKPNIQIGIGINTGIVTAGYMGSEKQLSYTVIGDNVNLGARVMANAKPMELLITRSVFERVKEYFEIEVFEPIMVKGKSMAIEIFLVKSLKEGVNLEEIMGAGAAMGAAITVGAMSAKSPTPRATSSLLGLSAEQQQKQNVQVDSKPKVIECANCGTENDMQIKFCSKCGMPIF